ncbi:MAG TPA: hypothetical protein P5123_06630 [Spirochaetota bacterium]|nr:hypothetical protein [Spirochaetota bacterium]
MQRSFIERLKSRKFLAAFFTALFIICNEGLGLGVDQQAYMWITGVVTAFILGESYIDAQAIGK